MARDLITVVILEGVPGAGKTSLLEEMRRTSAEDGRHVYCMCESVQLDAGDDDAPVQTFVAELSWLANWNTRLAALVKRVRSEHPSDAGRAAVVVCDRGPFSAALFVRNELAASRVLHDAARQSLCSAGAQLGVAIRHVVMFPAHQTAMFERVARRLLAQPGRSRFGEADDAWLLRVWSAYDELAREIDAPVLRTADGTEARDMQFVLRVA